MGTIYIAMHMNKKAIKRLNCTLKQVTVGVVMLTAGGSKVRGKKDYEG